MDNFVYALRLLRKSPAFTAVAVLSLALGIGANTAVFSLVNAVLLKTLPVQNPERLTQITIGTQASSMTNPLWEEIRRRQTVFEKVFAHSAAEFNLARGGETRMVPGLFVSGEFFDALGLRPVVGRLLGPRDDRRSGGAEGPVAVISYSFWQSEYGGETGVLDKAISIDGYPFTIVGVAPQSFFGLDVGQRFDIAIPIASEGILRGADSSLDQRSHWWLRVMGKLKPGHTIAEASRSLAAIQPGVRQATLPTNWPPEFLKDYLGEPLTVKSASIGLSELRRQYGKALLVLMGIAAMVLLLACANLANLLLARAAAREREIAVRLAIGAGRWRLVRQLLSESLLLSIAGAALGALFAAWGSSLLVRWLSTQHDLVFLDLSVDWRLLGFGIAVTLATTLLFGLVPALRATSSAPGLALKEKSRNLAGSRMRLERALVAVQIALSVVLVFGAGLFIRSFTSLVGQQIGFERKGVLLVSADVRKNAGTPEARSALYRQLLDAYRSVPGVRFASAAEITPIGRMLWNTEIVVEGSTAKDAESYVNSVSEDYFAVLGQALLAGRDFARGDTAQSQKVAIVNETFARKFFGTRSPIGKTYKERSEDNRWDTFEIVGLVKDAKYRSMRDPVPPTLYLPMSQQKRPPARLFFPLRVEGNLFSVRDGVVNATTAAGREIAVDFRSLETQVNEALIQERMIASLGGFFSVLALLLAAIGIYGVMSYSVTRRRGEIGVRIALGALPRRVVGLILSQVAVTTVLGLMLGFVLSLALGRLVATLLWGLKPDDALTMALAALVLSLTALGAGFLPSLRASRIQPLDALREE